MDLIDILVVSGTICDRERSLGGGQGKIGVGKLLRSEKFSLEFAQKVFVAGENAAFQLLPSCLVLERGKIDVRVTRKGTPFRVVTPASILGVRGTVFSVVVEEDGSTSVSVTEGTVWAENRFSRQKLELSTGMSADFPGTPLAQNSGSPRLSPQKIISSGPSSVSTGSFDVFQSPGNKTRNPVERVQPTGKIGSMTNPVDDLF